MNIVLLGLPGSGKGTQAEMLSKYFNIPHISTGDIFREILNTDSTLSKRIKDYVNNGLLVPDDIVSDIVQKRIEKKDCENGFVLDGFPRNITQAEFFKNYLGFKKKEIDAVIFFELPAEISIKRLSARRHCPKCKRDYNLITQPPKDDELCDVCKLKLVQRNDDKIETVTERINVYEKETEPLVRYYSEKNLLKRVNANQPIEKVFKDTIDLLKNASYN